MMRDAHACRAIGWAAVLCLSVPGLMGVSFAESNHVVHVPWGRLGDQMSYADISHGTERVAVAFEWSERRASTDAWGRSLDVDVLRQFDLVNGSGDEAGARWQELRSAFAGTPADPVWIQVRDTDQITSADNLSLPFLPALPTSSSSFGFNRSLVIFNRGEGFSNCYARFGLQGRDVSPGDIVPYADLCPGDFRWIRQVRAEPARAVQYQGAPAVELRYLLRATDEVPPSEGAPREVEVRVLLADGFPYILQLTWFLGEDMAGVRLAGYQRGTGLALLPRSPALPALTQRPGASFPPSTNTGPADGGSGLGYDLAHAANAVETDRTLKAFQAWRTGHPAAFVARATFNQFTDAVAAGPSAQEFSWTLLYQGPAPPGEAPEQFEVRSTRRAVSASGSLLPVPLQGPVQNEEHGEFSGEAAFRAPPPGTPMMDFASLIRAWRESAPANLRERAPNVITYNSMPPRPSLEVGVSDDSTQQGVSRELGQPSTTTYDSFVLNVTDGSFALHVADTFQFSYSALPLRLAPVAPASGMGGATVAPPAIPALEAAAGIVALGVIALLLHAPAAVFYSRLRGSEVLDHPVRRRLFEAIRAQPGLHRQALQNLAGIGHGSALHHLGVLERQKLIHHVRVPGYRRYFVAAAASPSDIRAMAALRSGRAQAIYDAVRQRPGISLSEVAQSVGVSPPAAHKAVGRLVDAGVLEKSRAGQEVRLTARPLGDKP